MKKYIQKFFINNPPIETFIGTALWAVVLFLISIPAFHFAEVFKEMGHGNIYNIIALAFGMITTFSFGGALSIIYLYFFSESCDNI